IETLDPVHRADPRFVTARQFLANAHQGRALSLTSLRRYADALADWDRAVELTDDPAQKTRIRLQRAASRARAGNPAAAADVEAVLPAHPAPSNRLYEAAAVLALLSGTARENATLADRHAARAVELLRQAFAKGFPDIARMLKDSDLDSLRRCDDYV